MTDHVEALHQARLKDLADTAASLAELEALAQSGQDEIEALAEASGRARGDEPVQPLTLDELRRYGIPALASAQVIDLLPEPEEEDRTNEGWQTVAATTKNAKTPDAMTMLDTLLTESFIDKEAPIEHRIDIVIADTGEAAGVLDVWPQPLPAESASLDDEIPSLEAELLTVLVSLDVAARDTARQPSALDVASISQPSWGPRAGQVNSDRRRSQINRATYAKKNPGARKYAKPSEMTDEERFAHEEALRRARKARELEQRKLKRAADKAADIGMTDD